MRINEKGPVQEPVQGRYKAVQAGEGMPDFTVPQRPANARALLVTERSAVWDVPADRPDVVADDGVARDPIWDHCDFTRWTPDLVHYRLVVMAETIKALPPVLRREYVSLLGSEAIGEMAGPVRSRPTPEDITVADWTLDRICERPDTQRVILMGMAFGMSLRKVATAVSRMGPGTLKVNKNNVGAIYLRERRYFAGEWQIGKAVLYRDGMAYSRSIESPASRLDRATIGLFLSTLEK